MCGHLECYCILCFTSQAPFNGHNYEEVKDKIKNCTEKDLETLFSPLKPEALVTILKKFCKKIPSERLSFSKFENERSKGDPFWKL